MIDRKVYVGGSQDLNNRRRDHIKKLRKNAHHNPNLQNSFNEYGENNFKLYILEFCNKEDLNEREEYWINELKANQSEFGYNIRIHAQTNRGLKLSDETKLKISKSLKEANLTISEEQKASISINNRGSKNGMSKLTEEDVIEIKKLLKNTNMFQKDIAKLFDISSRRVRGIKSGETWKHVVL